jgi:hypothetical protein
MKKILMALVVLLFVLPVYGEQSIKQLISNRDRFGIALLGAHTLTGWTGGSMSSPDADMSKFYRWAQWKKGIESEDDCETRYETAEYSLGDGYVENVIEFLDALLTLYDNAPPKVFRQVGLECVSSVWDHNNYDEKWRSIMSKALIKYACKKSK